MAWDDFVNDPLSYLMAEQQSKEAIDAQNKAAIQQPLSQEEQQSLFNKILGSGASALSFAGSTLGKLFGGRAIRAGLSGLTGGDMPWRELLSVIPGSDVTGLTDESQAVTGRKLLQQWNVAPEDKEEGFFSPANLAGLGIDIATDPSTYLIGPGAALTKEGGIAAKLGIVPKTTAARIAGYTAPEQAAAKLGFKTVPEATAYAAEHGINLPDLIGTAAAPKPLGGLGGWRIPGFYDETKTVFGTGPTAQKIAETIGKPFQWLSNTTPAAYLAAQFNPLFTEGGASVTDPIIQNRMLAEAPFLARRTEEFNRGLAGTTQELANALGGKLPEQHPELLRQALEWKPPTTPRGPQMAFPSPWAPDVQDAYTAAAAKFNALKDTEAELFRKAGGNLGEWDSIFGTAHASRAPTPLDVTTPQWTGSGRRENVMRQLYSGVGPAMERKEILDLPYGSTQVEGLVKNPLIGTEARTIGPAGRDIGWLATNEPRSQAVETKLSNVLGAFSPTDQATYVALRDRAASGIALTPAEQQVMDTLRRRYWSARRGATAVVRSDVLGGFNPRQLSAMERLATTRPLTPAETEQLANLRELSTASRYAAGKIQRLAAGRTPLPGEYADAATQILPNLKQSLQDRAAEAYLRGSSGIGVNAERLSDLGTKAGMTTRDLNDLAKLPGDERRKVLVGLTTPHPSGQGNAVSTAGQILTSDEAQELLEQAHLNRIAGPLAHYLGGLNPQRLQIGLFGNDPIADLMNYGRQMIRGTGKANIVNDLLAAHAIPTGPADTGLADVADVQVGKILDQLRLDTPRSAEIVGRGMQARGALGQGVMGLPGDVSKAGVPDEIASALMQLKQRGQIPENIAAPLRWFDALTQLTRASITAPFPGFHVRNLTTDVMNALQRGGPEALGWGGIATALAKGEAPAAIMELPIIKLKGFTNPRDAANFLNQEAAAVGGFGRGFGKLAGDVLDPAANPVMGAVPGVVPQPGLGKIMTGGTLPENWSMNPLHIQGLMGQTGTRFAPAAWGRNIAELEDAYARGGMWLHGLSQGYTPSAAANMAGQTIYHGAQFTPFEQNVMRRLVPFWGYSKFVVPQQLQFLAEHPGGLAAQGIRLSDNARAKGFLPDYMANSLAIPFGTESDGTQRYLSKIDMPWEALFNYLQPGKNANAAVYNSSMNMLSQLNPLVKGVLEGATNKQFLTGRDLDQLYGGATGVAAIDNLFYNSPASRAITTGMMLTDPRKYQTAGSALGLPLNLLTGAKVTDVDMKKQRGLAQLQALREYMTHDPNVAQHVNFTPAAGKELSPEEVQMFQLMKVLNAQNAAAARQKAAAGK